MEFSGHKQLKKRANGTRRHTAAQAALAQGGAMARKENGVRRSGNVRITNREKEVLQLLAIGYTSEGIGRKLKISTATASCHRCNLIKTLGVHNSQQAVVKALRLGLVKRDFVVDAMVGE
jgi:DNA-binding NarL/FixJ family response regulator